MYYVIIQNLGLLFRLISESNMLIMIYDYWIICFYIILIMIYILCFQVLIVIWILSGL